jgi:hypothetical protein
MTTWCIHRLPNLFKHRSSFAYTVSKCAKQGNVLRIISERFLLTYVQVKENFSLTYVLLRQTACCLFICYLTGLWQLFMSEIL